MTKKFVEMSKMSNNAILQHNLTKLSSYEDTLNVLRLLSESGNLEKTKKIEKRIQMTGVARLFCARAKF